MKKILFLFLTFGLLVDSVYAVINVEKFRSPDIKDDYCGSAIDFRFCKCAFHGDENYCKQIGQTESTANDKVQSGFSTYIDQKKSQFAKNCSGDNDILDGTTCTRCLAEHFKYKGACTTHVEQCGKDDTHLRFDVRTETCNCEPNYEKKDGGECQEVGPFEIKFDWQNEQKPPFLADGKNVGVALVSVRALKEKDQPFVPVKMVLTSGSSGSIRVEEEGDNHYRVTYTTPNLLGSDPSKNYYAGINLNFTVLNADSVKEEMNKVTSVGLVLYTPVKVASYGFDIKKENVVFKGGIANTIVNVKSDKVDGEFFTVTGARVELPTEKFFATDATGKARIPTPNDFLKGVTDDITLTLVLSEDVSKQLSQSRKKLADLGGIGENVVIKTFLNDFVQNLASAKTDNERKNLVHGLKRLNYALFFVNKGQEFGKVSSESLATVTKDAVANMVDLLDSVVGITGEITERLNAKGLKLGGKALEEVSKQTDQIYKASLLKLGAAMQAGVSYYAPNSKIYLGGLLQFLEDKYAIADNLKEKKAASLDMSEGIKEYFKKQANKASVKQMKEIETFIISGKENGFSTLDDSADLEIAKSNYTNLADKYLKAEKGEYWRAMTKSWFDLSFDTVGKGVSIVFPPLSIIIGQVENMYKVARSGFVDAPNMFQWYKTHADVMDQVDKGIKNSLGQKDEVQANVSDENLLPVLEVAYAENVSDPSLFMDAVADAKLYKSFAEIGAILASEFPNEAKEINVVVKQLKEKSNSAAKTAASLEDVSIKNIPEEDYKLWGVSEKELPSKNKNTQGIAYGVGIVAIFVGALYMKKKKHSLREL